MKIEVGPASLSSFPAPLTRRVTRAWQVRNLHRHDSSYHKWLLKFIHSSWRVFVMLFLTPAEFFYTVLVPTVVARCEFPFSRHDSSNSAHAYAWRNVWEKVTNSLGGVRTTNLETQKAQEHMHLKCCHGAMPTTSMWREWMAALELLAFPWRKKCRARSPTTPLQDLQPQI